MVICYWWFFGFEEKARHFRCFSISFVLELTSLTLLQLDFICPNLLLQLLVRKTLRLFILRFTKQKTEMMMLTSPCCGEHPHALDEAHTLSRGERCSHPSDDESDNESIICNNHNDTDITGSRGNINSSDGCFSDSEQCCTATPTTVRTSSSSSEGSSPLVESMEEEEDYNNNDDEQPPEQDDDKNHNSDHHKGEGGSVNVGQEHFGYPGLINLGNTCYMASALQMLATLDQFVMELQRHHPSTPTGHDAPLPLLTTDEQRWRLRQTFLELMQNLSLGASTSETEIPMAAALCHSSTMNKIQPDEFKMAMDERSDLFVGFHQQDAHEFVTTLLDLLDEDYTDHANGPASPLPITEKAITVEWKPKPSMMNHDSNPLFNAKWDHHSRQDGGSSLCETEEHIFPSLQKKPRVLSSYGYEENEESECNVPFDTAGANNSPKQYSSTQITDDEGETMSKDTMSSRISFSQLSVEDIGHLLYGTSPSATFGTRFISSSENSTRYLNSAVPALATNAGSCNVIVSTFEPRCKLVGGRMNTADVSLTRFVESTESVDPLQLASRLSATASSIEVSNSSPPEVDEGKQSVSPVAAHFTTKIRVRLTCDSCKYTRSHEETFLHLSLEIGSENGSVEDGLRRFLAPEKREIKCEKCFCATATQSSEIVQLPRALLLHFKRFLVDVSSDFSQVAYRKNQSPVQFDSELYLDPRLGYLPELMATDCVVPPSSEQGRSHVASLNGYQLRSIVNHIGSSASSGHYTTDAYRFRREPKRKEIQLFASSGCNDERPMHVYTEPQRQWLRFNDCCVSSITREQAIEESRRTVYMVLYEFE